MFRMFRGRADVRCAASRPCRRDLAPNERCEAGRSPRSSAHHGGWPGLHRRSSPDIWRRLSGHTPAPSGLRDRDQSRRPAVRLGHVGPDTHGVQVDQASDCCVPGSSPTICRFRPGQRLRIVNVGLQASLRPARSTSRRRGGLRRDRRECRPTPVSGSLTKQCPPPRQWSDRYAGQLHVDGVHASHRRCAPDRRAAIFHALFVTFASGSWGCVGESVIREVFFAWVIRSVEIQSRQTLAGAGEASSIPVAVASPARNAW